MHALAQFVSLLASPLLWLSHAFMPALADAGHRPPANTDFTVAAFAVSAALIGVVCSCSAAWMRARLVNFKIDAKSEKQQLLSELALRDSVVAQTQQSIVILGEGLASPISYGEGASMLEGGLAGRDAALLLVSRRASQVRNAVRALRQKRTRRTNRRSRTSHTQSWRRLPERVVGKRFRHRLSRSNGRASHSGLGSRIRHAAALGQHDISVSGGRKQF